MFNIQMKALLSSKKFAQHLFPTVDKKKSLFFLLSTLFHSSKNMWYIVYLSAIYFLISFNSSFLHLFGSFKVETKVEQIDLFNKGIWRFRGMSIRCQDLFDQEPSLIHMKEIDRTERREKRRGRE